MSEPLNKEAETRIRQNIGVNYNTILSLLADIRPREDDRAEIKFNKIRLILDGCTALAQTIQADIALELADKSSIITPNKVS